MRPLYKNLASLFPIFLDFILMLEEKFAEIAQDIQQHPILLYMKGDKDQPLCRFSLDVVRVLKGMNVDFETRDILQDEVLREAIKEFSNWPTLPQLYVRGEFIGGRDIVLELQETGELADILASKTS